MLRIAELFPDDVIAELYEDPNYPGCTFMELWLVAAPVAAIDSLSNVVYPEDYSHQWASGNGY